MSDVTDWAGYRAHSRSRATGTVCVLVDNLQAHAANQDDGRWVLICDDHGGLIALETQRQARSLMADPSEWCPGCQDNRDRYARLKAKRPRRLPEARTPVSRPAQPQHQRYGNESETPT